MRGWPCGGQEASLTEPCVTVGSCFCGFAPEIHERHAVDAADGAERCAPLRGQQLAADVVGRIGGERDAGEAALLRAPVDQPVLADVEIARAGATAPVVRLAIGEIGL